MGRPSKRETTSLLRLDSHQCGTQSGNTAIARSIATKGATVKSGNAPVAIRAEALPTGWRASRTSLQDRPLLPEGGAPGILSLVIRWCGRPEGELLLDQGRRRARRVFRERAQAIQETVRESRPPLRVQEASAL